MSAMSLLLFSCWSTYEAFDRMLQAWGAFENLMVLHVDHNSLSGYLPASFGNLRDLRILALGTAA